MSDHLKVGMADPMADGSLGTSEKVVDHGDFVTQEHQSVNEVRSDETSATGNQYTLALSRRQEFDVRETRESRVGDRMGVWIKYGLGCGTLGGFRIFCILLGDASGAWAGRDVVGSKIKRSEVINGDFAIEAEPTEANRLDFLSRLVQNLDLDRSEWVRGVRLDIKDMESWQASWDQRTRNTRFPAQDE